jgi:hypothetical protein
MVYMFPVVIFMSHRREYYFTLAACVAQVDYYLYRITIRAGVSEYFIMAGAVLCGQYFAPYGVQVIAQFA